MKTFIYKHLTAASAAAYSAVGIEKGNLALRDRYFAFLKAGGSEDPYVLLKRVGFDALDSSAWEEANWKSTRKNAPNLTHEEEESNDRN